MKKFSFIIILITVPTKKEAKKISDKLLQEKLAACVNIIKGVNSSFWWKNKIETANEFLLTVKTRSKFFNDIVKVVKSLHSYDIPEIIAVPIINVNKDYLNWIKNSLKNLQ
ncbi:MAG: divalent-cation tolerance protein CutA [Candidatus Ratteibacteria bacterium]|nr:divalent-cation tolerance protein CutA [Candidatus Ratteibacteria bacterium]